MVVTDWAIFDLQVCQLLGRVDQPEGRALAIRRAVRAEMLSRKVDAAVETGRCFVGRRGETRKMAGYVASDRLGSGGEPVLVQQPADAVKALNNIATFELVLRHVGDRRFEVDAAVRALPVVVGDELSQYALGMAFTA
jgi:hypothetical protein